MDPNTKPNADEHDDIPAGSEVDESFVDDDDLDTAAADAEEEAARAAAPDKTRADIMAEVRSAMNDAGGDGKPAEAAPAAAKPDGEADPAAAVEQPAAGAETKTPEQLAAEKAAEEAETARVAAVDKEADELRLKGKSRERFHDLNRRVAEGETANAALERTLADLKIVDKDGKALKGAEAMAALTTVVRNHEQFEDAIFASGITADDFKNVAGYKAAINSNDPNAWENARQFLLQELGWLETERMKMRPKDGEGEAYEAHEDLKDAVGTGAIDVKYANEIAASRNVRTAASSANKQSATETVAQQAQQTAAQECGAFAKQLAATDQKQWDTKWPVLQQKLAEIQTKFPPDQWRDRMELEYSRIAYTPAAPAPAAAAPAAAAAAAAPARTAIKPGALPRAGARRPAAAASGVADTHAGETPFEAMKRAMSEAGGGGAGDED